ncbi:unnamed protein product [Pneumocystis jirovecii]|uniref:CFEM domain-containing protein n=1 Tax=Pneumocystis jirovecii TaxID=42068 RepID=L0P959_PNEJI|nr:unnamed protein product [Pneumocystis jirovecii]
MKNILAVFITSIFLKLISADESVLNTHNSYEIKEHDLDSSTIFYLTKFEYYQNPDESVQDSSKISKKKKPSPPTDCISIFDGTSPEEYTKKCFLEGMNHTRCGSEVDIPCLCDSNKMNMVVKNCTSGIKDFSHFDPLFSAFYHKVCLTPLVPEPSCLNISNPSFPTVICDDPYKDSGLSEQAKQCLTSSANSSYCHKSIDLSCLCDSHSFNYNLHSCTYTNFTLQKEITKFLKQLCNIPPLVPGCTQIRGTESIAESIGERIMAVKTKGIIFSIIGIVMLVALGL